MRYDLKISGGHVYDGNGGDVSRDGTGRVFTVAPGVPFLDELARSVLTGVFASDELALDPMALGDVTILLPTRRAARQLQQSFLDSSRQKALLLPVIIRSYKRQLAKVTAAAAA